MRRYFAKAKSTFRAKNLKIERAAALAPTFTAETKLAFGAMSTPHMFEVHWSEAEGWSDPKIAPIQPLSIHPFNSTLHYALSTFEGQKAFKDAAGGLRLYRPDFHAKRFLESCQRLSLPAFDPAEFQECLAQYVKVERDWIPQIPGSALYLRPLALSMTNVLGVHAANRSAILIMASPVKDYFVKSSAGLRLDVNETYWRGTPHSASQYKIAANYGPTVKLSREAEQQGFSQCIWTFDECMLESGATNLFFLIKGEGEKLRLLTHPLDGSILPGATRDSLIKLASKIDPNVTVEERPIKISEFIDWHGKG